MATSQWNTGEHSHQNTDRRQSCGNDRNQNGEQRGNQNNNDRRQSGGYDRRQSGGYGGPNVGNDKSQSDGYSRRQSAGYDRRHSGGYSSQTGKGRKIESPDVKISKRLSYILRHGASKEGFKLLPGGYLYVDDLLRHKDFNSIKESDIERIVESNEKKRFHLERDKSGKSKIRANQGHSLQVQNLELTPILEAKEFPSVVHGTYICFWKSIKKAGLSKMQRNHIHCAPGIPGEEEVISGMRGDCDLLIYIDLEKALGDGLKFYKSSNNVILTEGNEEGFIKTAYFKEVVDRRTKEKLTITKDT